MWFEDQFFDFITFEKRFSAHTVTAYKNDIKQFIEHLSTDHSISDIRHVTHVQIRAWVVSMMQAGVSPRSVNRKLSCLKSYFKLLLKREVLAVNPMQKVVGPRTAKRLPKYILEDKMEILTALPPASDFKTARDRLILEILYQTGIRRGELLGIEWSDVDLVAGQLRVKGKGNKVRLVPFGRNLALQMAEYRTLREAEFPGSSFKSLFLTEKGQPLYAKMVYNIVNKYLSMVTTAEGKSPHVLRHSFATHLSDAGADLNAIKTLLGHANLAATQVYTHHSVEKLKRVYDAAHPKSGMDDGPFKEE